MNCAICGKTQDLFSIEFTPDETGPEDSSKSYVCGNCWRHIAAIATRAMEVTILVLNKRINELEARANE